MSCSLLLNKGVKRNDEKKAKGYNKRKRAVKAFPFKLDYSFVGGITISLVDVTAGVIYPNFAFDPLQVYQSKKVKLYQILIPSNVG